MDWSAAYLVDNGNSMRSFVNEHATSVQHRDGVPWDEAKKPGRLHRCSAQTTAVRTSPDLPGVKSEVQVCACGAIRDAEAGKWVDRNSRP